MSDHNELDKAITELTHQVSHIADLVKSLTEEVSDLKIMKTNFVYVAGGNAEEIGKTAVWNKLGRSIITKLNIVLWTAVGWIGTQIFQAVAGLIQGMFHNGGHGFF
jgi:hypothetical protein